MGAETWSIDRFVGDSMSIEFLVLFELHTIWAADSYAICEAISWDARTACGGKYRVVTITESMSQLIEY